MKEEDDVVPVPAEFWNEEKSSMFSPPERASQRSREEETVKVLLPQSQGEKVRST